MARHVARAALAVALAVVLSGCVRFSSSYTIQTDDTVDGTIFVALAEGYQTDTDPYKGTGAGDIAANFTNATITENIVAGWYGYIVDFTDEPLATFAWDPDQPWKLQITKTTDGYSVLGFNGEYTSDQVDTIQGADGWMTMSVTFPGALMEQYGAVASGTTDAGQGWAYWDLLAIEKGGSGQAYARGKTAVTFVHLVPGLLDDLFPDPATLPTEPAPAVTVTIAPHVEPVVTPTPDATPSVASTATPTAAPTGSDGTSDKTSIPVWVWAAGGALVAALAGLIGYTAANRKPKTPEPAVEKTPEPPVEKTPEPPKEESPK